MPLAAPRPHATMIAVGVARPSAQGQLMTSTLTAKLSARERSPGARTANQRTKVRRAMAITTGTKTPAMRSAVRSMGALELVASSTRRMMPASVVSSPTAVASTTIQPLALTVAPVTREPALFSAGRGSPVMADSSTSAEPSTTTPSTGTVSPARTTTRSPTRTSAVATSTSAPSRTTLARLGARSTSLLIASVVWALERCSKYLPSVMRVKIMAAESK